MSDLVIGTRGSPLALAQTRMIQSALERCRPQERVELKVIKTTGDAWAAQPERTEPLGKGLFTGELEAALRDGSIDLAVHSLKDLPVENPPGLILAAIPKRADARDVLITRGETSLRNLPANAVIATGSARRRTQIERVRADLRFADIRGNIDTRLKKFRENAEWSGMILAAAGLERLRPESFGLTVTAIPYEEMLPAPGQGALGLQMNACNPKIAWVQELDDAWTRKVVVAERAFLQALGGGCEWPIGAWARIEGKEIILDGFCQMPNQSGKRIQVRGIDPIELGRLATGMVQ